MLILKEKPLAVCFSLSTGRMSTFRGTRQVCVWGEGGTWTQLKCLSFCYMFQLINNFQNYYQWKRSLSIAKEAICTLKLCLILYKVIWALNFFRRTALHHVQALRSIGSDVTIIVTGEQGRNRNCAVVAYLKIISGIIGDTDEILCFQNMSGVLR
jgi:hypothetical protein